MKNITLKEKNIEILYDVLIRVGFKSFKELYDK